MRHYEVVSPEVPDYRHSWNEPPEPSRCGGIFLAENARSAIRQAVADEAFLDWVSMARGDGVPPFKGLKATRTLCEHGVCWGCAGDDEATNCPACQEAWDREDEESGLTLGFA